MAHSPGRTRILEARREGAKHVGGHGSMESFEAEERIRKGGGVGDGGKYEKRGGVGVDGGAVPSTSSVCVWELDFGRCLCVYIYVHRHSSGTL